MERINNIKRKTLTRRYKESNKNPCRENRDEKRNNDIKRTLTRKG